MHALVRFGFGKVALIASAVLSAQCCLANARPLTSTSTLLIAYNGSSTHTDANLNPHFTLTVKPRTLSVKPGASSSTQVVTAAVNGYSHALQLTVSNLPSGITASIAPNAIPAPGDGSSQLKLTVSNNAAPGTYLLKVTATDGTKTKSVQVKLNIGSGSKGPGATIRGCWYKENGHRYQGARVSVANPGTYPFDAYLYRGATCDPNNFADRIGFGTPLNFGGFDFIFWFIDFGDQTGTSALWYVGSDKSQCVDYSVTPDC